MTEELKTIHIGMMADAERRYFCAGVFGRGVEAGEGRGGSWDGGGDSESSGLSLVGLRGRGSSWCFSSEGRVMVIVKRETASMERRRVHIHVTLSLISARPCQASKATSTVVSCASSRTVVSSWSAYHICSFTLPFSRISFQGLMAGYDQKSNVVLSDSMERRVDPDNEVGVEEIPLGLYLVKGDMM